MHVLHRPGKLGLGTATLAAVRYAIDHQFDYLLNLDADFSHPPRFIPDLLKGMADHDVMIGSRYVPGGGVEGGFNLKRRLMSSGINGYARLMLGLTSKDNSGAFRCYRVSKLAEIDLDQVRSRGYSFQEEILYWCKSVGCRIGETPILFENRRAGVSKINMREAVSALWIIFAARRGRMTGRIARNAESTRHTKSGSSRRQSDRNPPRHVSPKVTCSTRALPAKRIGSRHLALADGDINLLASLGDFLAQSLVFALELAGVHAQHLAQKGAVAGVGLGARAGRAIPRSDRPDRARTAPAP